MQSFATSVSALDQALLIPGECPGAGETQLWREKPAVAILQTPKNMSKLGHLQIVGAVLVAAVTIYAVVVE